MDVETPKTEAIIATVETIQAEEVEALSREQLLATVEALLLHLDAVDALLSGLAQAAAQYDDGAMRSRRHIGDPDAPQPSCLLDPEQRASA